MKAINKLAFSFVISILMICGAFAEGSKNKTLSEQEKIKEPLVDQKKAVYSNAHPCPKVNRCVDPIGEKPK